MSDPSRCWCSDAALGPFGAGYRRCSACGTLVQTQGPAGDLTRVRNDGEDFYGRSYWFEHQRELGQPDLERRSVEDLTGRCLDWLRATLSYKLPPGRSLELGAAHGAFVALLSQAGFEATGLELSPWVVDFARRRFSVPMLAGPIEEHELDPSSLDLVLAFDVLEHLPDPLATLTRSARLLKDDGVLLIQTPCLPEDRSYEELTASAHPFLAMLLPEHLFLFNRRSIQQLLQQLGLAEVVFLAPPFPSYDMLLVASRSALKTIGPKALRAELLPRSDGAAILGLLDLHDRLTETRERFTQADVDRTERQRQIEQLQGLLKQETEERLRQREGQTAIEEECDRLRAESQERLATVERLHREGAAQAAERERQGAELERLRAELTEAGAQKTRLQTELAAAELERRRFEEELRGERAEHSRTREQLREREDALTELDRRHRILRHIAMDHRQSRLYRAMVRTGRWRRYDEHLTRALGTPVSRPQPNGVERCDEERWRFDGTGSTPSGPGGTVAVDLTALLPGGENGGAKLIATALVEAWSRLAPTRRWLLLTAQPCHEELAHLDAQNVSRRCVGAEPTALSSLIDEQQIGALFCPMTVPPFSDPRVPTICLVHDLQHLSYPQFFSDGERLARDQALARVALLADRVITVSDFVRRTVIDNTSLPEDRITRIHHGVADRLPEPSAGEVIATLERLGLEAGSFLLYPANFWPHKNHRMLLTAFGLLRRRLPESDLKLVLTGSARPDPEPLRRAVRGMGLDEAVAFPGYISELELACLFRSALGLVFPSLYEGFGMPVIEAMSHGCPVLCSRVTSLPEVAGDSAILFDPRRPQEIAAAMARLVEDSALARRLRERGRRRAASFGDLAAMAESYLDVIDRTRVEPRRWRDSLAGVCSDGWTLGSFVVSHCHPAAELELGLTNPRPEAVSLTAIAGGQEHSVSLGPHQPLRLHCRLPPEPSCLRLSAEPTFCPAESGVSSDERHLGLEIWACRLRHSDRDVDLLAELGHG